MEVKHIPEHLRKLAKSLREEAAKVDEFKRVKSAQVLVAAQGLVQLEKIIMGEIK